MDDLNVAITLFVRMALLWQPILNYPVLHDCYLSFRSDDVWHVIRHMASRSFLYINHAVGEMRAMALNSWWSCCWRRTVFAWSGNPKLLHWGLCWSQRLLFSKWSMTNSQFIQFFSKSNTLNSILAAPEAMPKITRDLVTGKLVEVFVHFNQCSVIIS